MSQLSGKQKVILVTLALVLVVVWTRALRSLSGPRASSAPGTPAAARVSPHMEKPLPAGSPEGKFPEGDWRDSPFLTERSAGSAPSDVSDQDIRKKTEAVLSGILWDPMAPSAVVNNRVVGVGDSVGVWTVVEIRRDRVILSDGTRTRRLEVD